MKARIKVQEARPITSLCIQVPTYIEYTSQIHHPYCDVDVLLGGGSIHSAMNNEVRHYMKIVKLELVSFMWSCLAPG